MTDSTTILSPYGTVGGNAVAPRPGTPLAFGVIIPHHLPTPENFRMPSIATPSVSRPLVSSTITPAPPASSDGRFRLPSISAPSLPATKPGLPRNWLRIVRRTSRTAVDRVSHGVQVLSIRWGGGF